MADFKQDNRGKYKKSLNHKQKISDTLKGRKLSDETKKKISLAMKRERPKTAFKKGHIQSEIIKQKIRETLTGTRDENSRAHWEYRRLAEEKHGRKILDTECVHHIDGNYRNNCPDNLEIMDSQEHRRMHALKQGFGRNKE